MKSIIAQNRNSTGRCITREYSQLKEELVNWKIDQQRISMPKHRDKRMESENKRKTKVH